MLRPGLVSVTFRNLPPAEIVRLARQARLEGIEWGGDIHVPHGDLNAARLVRQLTQDAGLSIAAYGSYYRAAAPDSPPFRAVLQTAAELAAPTIRVWAGRHGSADTLAPLRAAIVADLRHIAELAQSAGISISLELHGGTLTDTTHSAALLLREVSHPNLHLYWQPPEGWPTADCLASIAAFLPQITNVHIFHWMRESYKTIRHALKDGEQPWRSYLQIFSNTKIKRWALLEFVRNDDPQQFLADSATLHDLLRQSASGLPS